MKHSRIIGFTIATAVSLTAVIIDIDKPNNGKDEMTSLPSAISDADFIGGTFTSDARVKLGNLLFFDKILSGNRNISCATCHHPKFATADGVALPLGEGPSGLGPERQIGDSEDALVHERVPRNSPALFNLGATEFTRLFHDGRVEVDSAGYYDGGFITPAKWKLPKGLENTLAAQAMFPVGSPAEMAGQRGENSMAEATALNNLSGANGLWEQLAVRLQSIPAYVEMFKEAFPDEVSSAHDISMVHAANAIASFQAVAFRSDNSPFDNFLRTGEPLNANAVKGLKLFYGKANCSGCHSGKFQTDHDFHSIAMPQIGPGKNHGRDQSYWRSTGQSAFLEDFGRGRVTYRPEDAFKFRTPSLRNVELTAPYGHAGSYRTLEEVVMHHVDPVQSLMEYDLPNGLLQPLNRVVELRASGPRLDHYEMSNDRREGFLERDNWVMRNKELVDKIASANELAPSDLSGEDVSYIVAFLKSLTDDYARNLEQWIPESVPSSLNVDR